MTWTISEKRPQKTPILDLIFLYGISVASVVSYGVFRIWPELLTTVPNAMAVYPRAFQIFPRAQIILAFLVLALFLSRRAGGRWIPAFVAVYLISLGSELAGTTVGLPFGPYHYTSALGAKWFAHVPVLIPVSWFMMALPSFALARHGSASTTASRVRRIIVASLILLAWDLALDPAMSGATAFWVWGSEGPYYGMPWLNLFGWFVTGVVLMGAMTWLKADRWVDSLSRPWLAGYYGANLALPIGFAAIAGMWGALAATTVALAGCWMLARNERVAVQVPA